MNVIDADNANPELVAKVEAHTKELGFNRVRCDYCDHQIPMSIKQEREGYVPPSVCQSCATDITKQLEELGDEWIS